MHHDSQICPRPLPSQYIVATPGVSTLHDSIHLSSLA